MLSFPPLSLAWRLFVALLASPLAFAVIPKNPFPAVWHDNDDDRDVYTQEFLLALAASGTINLVGTSTSTPVSPFNPYVTPQDAAEFVAGMIDIQALASQTWTLNFPPVTPQVLAGHFTVPSSGLIEDTLPLNSVVGNAIAAAARTYGTSEKPMIVVCGGPLTAVADAYLTDPSIADKILVTWLGGTVAGFREYNSAIDGWGNAVAAKYLRIIMFPIDIPTVETSSPIVSKADLSAALPASPLRQQMILKDHPGNPLPGSIDADGPPAVVMINPAFIKTSVNLKVTSTTTHSMGGRNFAIPVLSADPTGNVTMVTSVDQGLGTRIWWRAFERAHGKLLADPIREYPLTDVQTAAQVGFATHELSASYRGPLLGLRRESDGALLDFYEGNRQGSLNTVRGGGGQDLSGWAGPNGEVRVMTWYDQSGNARNATSSSPANAPRIMESGRIIRGTRNEPVLRFAPADSLAVNDGNALSNIRQLSVSLWGLVDEGGNQNRGFLTKSAIAPTTGKFDGWGVSVAGPDQYRLQVGSPTTSLQAQSAINTAVRSRWNHKAKVFNGFVTGNTNRLQLRVDGRSTTLGYDITVPDRIAAVTNPLILGTGGTNLGLDGQLAEVMAWTIPLTATQTNRLHSRRYVPDFSTFSEAVPYHEWIADSQLQGPEALEDATPKGDGIRNLLKYAFNLNPNSPDNRVLIPGKGGSSGLPGVSVKADAIGNTELRLEYLCRRNAGVTYHPQVAENLGQWRDLEDVPVITPIDAEWERATIINTASSAGVPRRFVRLLVQIP